MFYNQHSLIIPKEEAIGLKYTIYYKDIVDRVI